MTPGTVLTLNVRGEFGQYGEPSTVDIGNGDIISAQPGQDSQADYHGGDGYSGGGGGGDVADGGAGGSDGSDGAKGADGPGGSGTGEDLSLYVFDAWTLSPGPGGEVHNGAGGGGGGGGVLVDGAGPEIRDPREGHGYGGGGANGADAHQGLILVETTSSS